MADEAPAQERRSTSWWLIAAGLLLAVTSFAVVWRLASRQAGAPTFADPATPAVGGVGGDRRGPLPDFELASLDGRRLGPADFAGKVVLIDFWATWCGPCHLQADVLRELYPRFRGPRVEFLAVDVGEDPEIVRDFVGERPFDYPVLLDPESEVADALGVMALPSIVIVDRQRRVIFSETGLVDGETIARVLRQASAG